MSELNKDQVALASLIKELSAANSGKDRVPGWDLELYNSVTGRGPTLPKVPYGAMAKLLSLARLAGGWFITSESPMRFVTWEEWKEEVKSRRKKAASLMEE
jgi:hypothetical protein